MVSGLNSCDAMLWQESGGILIAPQLTRKLNKPPSTPRFACILRRISETRCLITCFESTECSCLNFGSTRLVYQDGANGSSLRCPSNMQQVPKHNSSSLFLGPRPLENLFDHGSAHCAETRNVVSCHGGRHTCAAWSIRPRQSRYISLGFFNYWPFIPNNKGLILALAPAFAPSELLQKEPKEPCQAYRRPYACRPRTRPLTSSTRSIIDRCRVTRGLSCTHRTWLFNMLRAFKFHLEAPRKLTGSMGR